MMVTSASAAVTATAAFAPRYPVASQEGRQLSQPPRLWRALKRRSSFFTNRGSSDGRGQSANVCADSGQQLCYGETAQAAEWFPHPTAAYAQISSTMLGGGAEAPAYAPHGEVPNFLSEDAVLLEERMRELVARTDAAIALCLRQQQQQQQQPPRRPQWRSRAELPRFQHPFMYTGTLAASAEDAFRDAYKDGFKDARGDALPITQAAFPPPTAPTTAASLPPFGQLAAEWGTQPLPSARLPDRPPPDTPTPPSVDLRHYKIGQTGGIGRGGGPPAAGRATVGGIRGINLAGSSEMSVVKPPRPLLRFPARPDAQEEEDASPPPTAEAPAAPLSRALPPFPLPASANTLPQGAHSDLPYFAHPGGVIHGQSANREPQDARETSKRIAALSNIHATSERGGQGASHFAPNLSSNVSTFDCAPNAATYAPAQPLFFDDAIDDDDASDDCDEYHVALPHPAQARIGGSTNQLPHGNRVWVPGCTRRRAFARRQQSIGCLCVE